MVGSSHLVSLSTLVRDWLRSWTCLLEHDKKWSWAAKGWERRSFFACFHSLGLAFTVADTDARKAKPSGADAHKRGGALPVVGATPVLARGNAGVEPADDAEKAVAAKPKALVPWAQDMARRKSRHKRASQSSRHRRKGADENPRRCHQSGRECGVMLQGTPNEGTCKPSWPSREQTYKVVLSTWEGPRNGADWGENPQLEKTC